MTDSHHPRMRDEIYRRSRRLCFCVFSIWLLCALYAAVAAEVATRAAIRSDGTLLVDGKPVFPVGARTESATDIQLIAETGFNLVMGSGEWDEEHYAEAEKQGLLIFAAAYSRPGSLRPAMVPELSERRRPADR